MEQAGNYGSLSVKDSDSGGVVSTMESVLSLDDGRWSHPAEESSPAIRNEATEDPFRFVGIRQPSPPLFSLMCNRAFLLFLHPKLQTQDLDRPSLRMGCLAQIHINIYML